MNDERRYDQDEADRIFHLATEPRDDPSPSRSAGDGLTLRELQAIGEEAGIPEDRVARAAHDLDHEVQTDTLRRLGLPVGVGRTVALPRPLTGREWERLVAHLRTTFSAPGEIDTHGALRQWSNGNLRVDVEPTEDGYQLRLETFKGSLRPTMSIAASVWMVGIVLGVLNVISGGQVNLEAAFILGAIGAGVALTHVASLPRWARTRARQMEATAAAVLDWTSRERDEESPETGEDS